MDDTMAVLRDAVRRSKDGPQTRADVRLALEALRFVGMPADAIFYSGAPANRDEIGRSQSMNAALDRIDLPRTGTLMRRP